MGMGCTRREGFEPEFLTQPIAKNWVTERASVCPGIHPVVRPRFELWNHAWVATSPYYSPRESQKYTMPIGRARGESESSRVAHFVLNTDPRNPEFDSPNTSKAAGLCQNHVADPISAIPRRQA